MNAYKGFDKNMRCRGFQFVEGETYEENEAVLCKKGFHACTNPIDVFRYYSPTDSVYRNVELDGVSEKRKNDSKICGKKIKIGAKLTLGEMIRAGVEIDIESVKNAEEKSATSGDSSPAATSGDFSHAATSDNYSPAATSGDYSHAATSGNYSPAATSGYSSPAATSGNSSHAATSGDHSHAATSGKNSIAAAIGRNSIAKSSVGSWIVLAEYGEWDGQAYPVLCVKSAQIDGETLRPDTWYRLVNGEFVEVDSDV